MSAHDAYLKVGELDAKLAEVRADLRREQHPDKLLRLIEDEARLLKDRKREREAYAYASARELAGLVPIEASVPRRTFDRGFGEHLERKPPTFQSNRKAS